MRGRVVDEAGEGEGAEGKEGAIVGPGGGAVDEGIAGLGELDDELEGDGTGGEAGGEVGREVVGGGAAGVGVRQVGGAGGGADAVAAGRAVFSALVKMKAETP